MIQGYFAGLSPYVRLLVSIPVFATGYLPVRFLVDTGATMTVLHPRAARVSLSIPEHELDARRWERVEPVAGIGGLTPCLRARATYVFEHDDGEYDAFEDDILVAAATRANAEAPSLLGANVLRHFRLTADYPRLRVTLE